MCSKGVLIYYVIFSCGNLEFIGNICILFEFLWEILGSYV